MPRETRRGLSRSAKRRREDRAYLLQSGLDLGPTLMNRKRLQELELITEGLERATTNISDAKSVLWERRDEHVRRHSVYGNESEPVDEEEALETARCTQVLKRILMSDRERIIKFMEAKPGVSDVSIEERMDLDAVGVDFDVLEEYLTKKYNRTRKRLMEVQK